MTASPGEALAHRFFSGTGASYDRIVNLWTIGFDRWWKNRIVAQIAPAPRRILDQASGTGILTLKIARMFPDCRVVGVELREEYAAIARKKSAAQQMDNVAFIIGRAEDVVLKTDLDCITSSYLAKYAEIATLVDNAQKMLRDGGRLIVHDFVYPPGRLFARLWEIYFKLMQTAGSRRYPQWRLVFHELPPLLRRTRWVTELVAALREHAFADIAVKPLTFGSAALVTAEKKASFTH